MRWTMRLPVISQIVGNQLSVGGTTIDTLFTVQKMLRFFLFSVLFPLLGVAASELV